MTVPYSAGALCSSALDLASYQRALVSGSIVSRASYQRMAAPAVLKDGWKTIYGLGLVNDGLCRGADGGTRGPDQRLLVGALLLPPA